VSQFKFGIIPWTNPSSTERVNDYETPGKKD
jgi:hypothetical protein